MKKKTLETVARKEMNDARTSSTKFGSVKRSRYAPHHFCRFVIVTSEIRLILASINWPKLHRWSMCIIYFFPSNMLQQFGVFFSSFLYFWLAWQNWEVMFCLKWIQRFQSIQLLDEIILTKEVWFDDSISRKEMRQLRRSH